MCIGKHRAGMWANVPVTLFFFVEVRTVQLTSSPRLRRGIPYCVADLAVSRFDGFLLLDGLCRLT